MPYVQSSRLCSLRTPLGDDALMLLALHGEESLSRPFCLTAEVVSESADVAMDAIIGKPASIRLELADGSARHFHGIVARFEQAGRDQRLVVYRAEIRPWLWLLTRRADCRIFQHMDVPTIVGEVFRRAGFADFEARLEGAYREREFCVQYRETDFAFVSRLLEEEGIFYSFEHHEDRHVLVLGDTPASVPVCPEQARARYAGDLGGVEVADEIRGWRVQRTLHPGRYELKDYNFEDPGNPLAVDTGTTTKIGGNAGLAIYDHHPSDYGNTGDGKRRAEVRMEELETGALLVHGDGTCRAFSPGFRFTLEDHFRSEVDGKQFMLTSVTHHVRQAGTFATGQPEGATYDNSFTCVPSDVPYRPARVTPRPHINGPQTAIVTGAAGEEIDVDEYGRVWVQFHWDREGKRNDKSSCRVRVTQAWASKNFGFVAHPRVGDEVIVEFLEGDPDKPIVTGCVYNKQTMPPYGLPANKTQSGLKSRSSKGGSPANFNEIRFEDKKGSEEVFIQAEKNKTVLVKNDRTENVGNDETISIGHDRKEQVEHDEKITIGNDRTECVGKNETITIGVNRTESVGSNESITIGANKTIVVGAAHTETIGAAMSLAVGASKTESVAIASNEMVGAAKTTTVGAAYALTVGAAMNVAVGGASAEEVGALKSVNVGGKMEVTVAQAYESSAKKIIVTGEDQIELVCGAAKLTLKKSGEVSIEGTQIKIQGAAVVDIKGTLVKINS